MNKDIYFLKKTFKLARKAEGFTSPNPLVGAVIVKNDRVIAQDYHKKAGLPHAEIEAINKAREAVNGATLYVNLEPCCHFGRTPPCVDEIIKAKIKEVVIAILDPNPKMQGRSIKKLKAAGIKLKVGVLADQAKKLNEIFFKNMKKKLPFVAAKIAQSLDGKIATKTGQSKWITTDKSRLFAKSLRDKYDCVLVGINTVIKDNPRLNGLKKVPYKAVIDPKLKLPFNSYLAQHARAQKLLIFTSDKNKGVGRFPAVAKVFFIKEKNKRLPVKEILRELYKIGITSVFVEGGSETLGTFFDQKAVDKIYLFISPKIIGGSSALTSIGAKGYPSPNSAPQLTDIHLLHFGQDLLIYGYPIYEKK
jgi:diaminohydroxyphosphoribosylaminopyrimidine deaminase/5-amino-6-(5-phosphoribosylamino)uracil reductase